LGEDGTDPWDDFLGDSAVADRNVDGPMQGGGWRELEAVLVQECAEASAGG
jgi:hypothetical protein